MFKRKMKKIKYLQEEKTNKKSFCISIFCYNTTDRLRLENIDYVFEKKHISWILLQRLTIFIFFNLNPLLKKQRKLENKI